MFVIVLGSSTLASCAAWDVGLGFGFLALDGSGFNNCPFGFCSRACAIFPFLTGIFGLTKMTSGVRKSPYHGVERTYAPGQYVVAAWNLMRMAKLLVSGPPKVSRA